MSKQSAHSLHEASVLYEISVINLHTTLTMTRDGLREHLSHLFPDTDELQTDEGILKNLNSLQEMGLIFFKIIQRGLH